MKRIALTISLMLSATGSSLRVHTNRKAAPQRLFSLLPLKSNLRTCGWTSGKVVDYIQRNEKWQLSMFE